MSALAALWFTAASSLAADSQWPADLESRIDRHISPYLADGHLSGSLLVADRERVLYERSFGMASHELGVPNDPGIRHCVASITKPMTVVILARLIEAGKLAADDPIAKWIPEFPKGDAVTVERLARHQAGIPHRLVEDADQTEPRSAADMVELAKEADFVFEPGTDSSYSSGGYSVLARVLELAGGGDYQELLERHVLAPAGMTDTAHTDSRQILPRRASSYFLVADGDLIHAPLRDLSFLVGAGSVYSTPRDLWKMMRTLVGGGYGAAASEQLVRDGSLNWNGVTHGFRAFADFHGERDLFVIFAGNLQTGAIDRLRSDLPRLAAGEELEPPVPFDHVYRDVPPEVLERYTGSYELRPGSLIRLHVEDGVLFANDWPMLSLSEREFFVIQQYAHVTVVVDDAGRAERLDWGIGDQVYPLPRVGDAP